MKTMIANPTSLFRSVADAGASVRIDTNVLDGFKNFWDQVYRSERTAQARLGPTRYEPVARQLGYTLLAYYDALALKEGNVFESSMKVLQDRLDDVVDPTTTTPTEPTTTTPTEPTTATPEATDA